MTKALIFGLIALISLALCSDADAVDLATTQVSTACEGFGSSVYYDSGQQPYEQTINESWSQGGGYATAGFGSGLQHIGAVSSQAEIYKDAFVARADFSASTAYYFEIVPINGGAGISQIPILFGASGEGSAMVGGVGLARVLAIAVLGGEGLFGNEMRIGFDQTIDSSMASKTYFNSFNGTLSHDLVMNSLYTVGMTAACGTWGLSASCTAETFDSFVSFDQAAFDRIMGLNTFDLDEYYRIVFSENLPAQQSVPEPTTMLLLGLGLAGLAGVRRFGK